MATVGFKGLMCRRTCIGHFGDDLRSQSLLTGKKIPSLLNQSAG